MDEDTRRILDSEGHRVDWFTAVNNIPKWLIDYAITNRSDIYFDSGESEAGRHLKTIHPGLSIKQFSPTDSSGIRHEDIIIQRMHDENRAGVENGHARLNGNPSFWVWMLDASSLAHTETQLDAMQSMANGSYHCVDWYGSFLPQGEAIDGMDNPYVLAVFRHNALQGESYVEFKRLDSLQACLRLVARLCTITDENEGLSQSLDEANSKLMLLTNSTIWRMTLPLRKVLDKLRHVAIICASLVFTGIDYCKEFAANRRSQNQANSRLGRKQFFAFLQANRHQYKGVFIHAAPVGWDITLIQRPHHLCRALARSGYLVVYLSPNKWRDRIIGYNEVAPNLFVTLDRSLLDNITGAFVSFCSTSSAYPPELIDRVRKNRNKMIYEYIDHIDPKISGSTVEDLLDLYDYVSTDTIDYVFASSEALVREINQNVNAEKIVFIPNAVDTDHYTSRLNARTPPPVAIDEIVQQNKPIIGYFGAVAPWLWYPLITALVETNRQYNFVFIGPDYLDSAKLLPEASNFYNLGAVNYQELADYARHFKVGLIPFAPGKISQTTSPLKLFEYFALQKPVVVTYDMHECTIYNEVLAARSVEEFSRQIDRAVNLADQQDFKNRLSQLALENSWLKRAEKIHAHIH